MAAPFAPSDRALAPKGGENDNRDFSAQRPPATNKDLDRLFPGEETVVMQFPRPVLYTTKAYKRVQFSAGLNPVPVSISQDSYILACGATVYRMPEPKPPVPPVTNVKSMEQLQAMTKAEILDHAKEVHGLELDPVNKKDDLILAIEEHKEARAKA